jgi:hypothetical protein
MATRWDYDVLLAPGSAARGDGGVKKDMLRAATHPELFDRAQWFAADVSRREQLARTVEGLLLPDFEYVGLRAYAGTDLEIAVYRHLATSQRFSLIPGGSFEMGMSPEEEQAIVDARPDVVDDEDNFIQEFDLLLSEMATMRPLHDVTLQPFLLAQRVLDVGQVRRYIGDFTDPLYGDSPEVPAHLSNEQAIAVLVGTGLRLPSEAELEGGARGHLRRSLLPTSTRIPDEDSIEAMLADEAEGTSNAFGLHGYGLYPERCADAWHEHYRGAPADGSAWSGPGPRVVRGGAANCYPWQACGEWNVMLCAFRMSDHAAEFGAAIRPARSICPAPLNEPAARHDNATAPTTKKKTAKKAASKKANSKKANSKKETSTKTATKKTATKKATATKKPATKKPATKKATSSTKTATKKPATKKATSKKPAAKKATAKKTATKKATSKKATSKKPIPKQTATKQPVAKKP